jgi:hypothetical protein
VDLIGDGNVEDPLLADCGCSIGDECRTEE